MKISQVISQKAAYVTLKSANCFYILTNSDQPNSTIANLKANQFRIRSMNGKDKWNWTDRLIECRNDIELGSARLGDKQRPNEIVELSNALCNQNWSSNIVWEQLPWSIGKGVVIKISINKFFDKRSYWTLEFR